MTVSEWTAVCTAITAVAGAVIAFAGLVIALVAYKSAKAHEKRAVRPLLRIDYLAQWNELPCIRLVNVGAGPAIIESVDVRVNGEKLEDHPVFKHAAIKAGLIPSLREPANWYKIAEGGPFGAGESVSLLALLDPATDRDKATEILEKMATIHVEVRYKSLHDESFTAVTTNSREFLARTA